LVPQSQVQGFLPSGPILQIPAAILFQNASVGLAAEAQMGLINRTTALRLAESAEHSLAQYPDDLRVQNNAAVVFMAAGNAERASFLLRQAQAKAPEDPTIAYNYARCLYQKGQIPEAASKAQLATFRCKIASSGPDYKWGPAPKFRHIEPNPTSLIDFFVEKHCVCRYNSVRA
jgi:hypothetical protein